MSSWRDRGQPAARGDEVKLEGLIAKRAESVYVPGSRSRDWVKIKRKGAVPSERFKHSRRGNG
jgi:ATP-dependent DNA ligase